MDIGAILKELFGGVGYLFSAEGCKTLVMFAIAGALIYLAIKKDYEPTLLLPIGFGAILANLPPVIDAVSGQAAASVLGEGGFLTVLFYNVVLITHDKTLDFGKLSGFIYFSGVILFCFYSLIHLKRCLPMDMYGYDAIYFILLILCFAWGGDTCAYFAGRAFGKHKLAPIVSPHKTVEGAVGGVLGSMAAGCVLTLVYSLLSAKYNVISIQVQPKHYLVLLGMGAVASVLGILGDLFASSVKRQVGIKDYGTIFPGHGGILDRFDSVMFIAPFVSIAVRYFFYLL